MDLSQRTVYVSICVSQKLMEINRHWVGEVFAWQLGYYHPLLKILAKISFLTLASCWCRPCEGAGNVSNNWTSAMYMGDLGCIPSAKLWSGSPSHFEHLRNEQAAGNYLSPSEKYKCFNYSKSKMTNSFFDTKHFEIHNFVHNTHFP